MAQGNRSRWVEGFVLSSSLSAREISPRKQDMHLGIDTHSAIIRGWRGHRMQSIKAGPCFDNARTRLILLTLEDLVIGL
jgi:hypothetical protein